MTRATDDRIGDGPIDPKLVDMMNALGRGIDDVLNGDWRPKKNGFVLMVFPLNDHGGRCNYISNTRREDVLVMLKEQVARWEGGA